MTTGRFQEAEPHRLLSGDESEERTVPSVPFADGWAFEKQTFRNSVVMKRIQPMLGVGPQMKLLTHDSYRGYNLGC